MRGAQPLLRMLVEVGDDERAARPHDARVQTIALGVALRRPSLHARLAKLEPKGAGKDKTRRRA